MYAHASSWTVGREIDKQNSVHSKSDTASQLHGWLSFEEKGDESGTTVGLLDWHLRLSLTPPSIFSGNLSYPNALRDDDGDDDDVCVYVIFFHSPNSQKAVQILSVSSKAQSRAGLSVVDCTIALA